MTRLGLLAVAGLVACADAASSEVGALGAACGPVACEGGLVCSDGRCRERVWQAPMEPELPPVVGFDVVPHEVAAEVTDAVTPDVADATVAGADADPGQLAFLGEHSAFETPSDTHLTLGIGQVAVREFEVPDGTSLRLVGLEVILTTVAGIATCGRFNVILWLPDARGEFPIAPSWQSPELLLSANSGPQLAVLDETAPLLMAGRVRAGLAYVGVCEGVTFAPWIAVDLSGDVTDSFVWAGNWIPGSSLGLPGRWAMRLAVTDGLP